MDKRAQTVALDVVPEAGEQILTRPGSLNKVGGPEDPKHEWRRLGGRHEYENGPVGHSST